MSLYCLWNDCESLHPFLQLLLLIGTVLAVVVCWHRTRSILVATLAGLFGWLYILYHVIYTAVIKEKSDAD